MNSEEYDLDPNRFYNQEYDSWRVKGVKDIIGTYKNAAEKMLKQSNKRLQDEYLKEKANEVSVMTGGEQLFKLNENRPSTTTGTIFEWSQ